MSGRPIVSIVIPTFNRVEYLEKCIDACLAQTYPCEVIVCDHGSVDATPQLAERYKGKIKYIRRETDKGVHFCWLDGVINAEGEYIHFNYDDDWIEETFIEECMDLFKDDVGFVFSNAKFYYEDKKTFEGPAFKFLDKTGIHPSSSVVRYELTSLISPACTILRKKEILDNLFVGEVPFAKYSYRGVGPDLLFTLMTTLTYKKVGFVNKELSIFRVHEGSITTSAQETSQKLEKLWRAYESARVYYLVVKWFKMTKIDYLIRKYLILKRSLQKK